MAVAQEKKKKACETVGKFRDWYSQNLSTTLCNLLVSESMSELSHQIYPEGFKVVTDSEGNVVSVLPPMVWKNNTDYAQVVRARQPNQRSTEILSLPKVLR